MAASLSQVVLGKATATTWASMTTPSMTTAGTFCGILQLTYDGGSTLSTIVDSMGNPTGTGAGNWERIFHQSTASACWFDIWVIYGGVGGAGHNLSFTGTSTPYGVAIFGELTGYITPGSPFGTLVPDGAVGGSPRTFGSGTLAQADNVLLSGIGGSPQPLSVGAPWTLQISEQDSANYWTSGLATLNVTSTASQNVTWTWTGPGTVQLYILPVLSAAGGGGGYAGVPGQAALALTNPAPTLAQTANLSLTPAQQAITIGSPAPTLAQTANQSLTPAQKAITIGLPAPTLTQTANQSLVPGQAAITIAGPAPSLVQTGGTALVPGAKAIAITGPDPTLAQTANQSLVPAAKAIAITGPAPTLTQSSGTNLVPGPDNIVIGGPTPTLTQTTNYAGVPGTRNIVIGGPAPSIRQGPPPGQGSSAVRRYLIQAYEEYFRLRDEGNKPKPEAAPVRVPKKLARTALVEPVPLPDEDTAAAASMALRLLHSQNNFKARLERLDKLPQLPLAGVKMPSSVVEQDEDELLLLAVL